LLIKVMPKCEMSETGWEIVDWLVEATVLFKFQMSKTCWEMIDWITEITIKCEMG